MDALGAEFEGCYRSKNPASEMTVRVQVGRRKQERVCAEVDIWESGAERLGDEAWRVEDGWTKRYDLSAVSSRS
jgi:hypothetical protein